MLQMMLHRAADATEDHDHEHRSPEEAETGMMMTMLLGRFRLKLISKLNASAPQDEQMAGN